MTELSPLRLGRLTASKAAVVMGGLKTSGLATLVKRCAWERVYGDTGEEGYRSGPMLRGQELEAQAMDWYEFETDVSVVRGEFVPHPTIAFVGATPDGRADDRVVEVKCLLHSAWMDVHRDREVLSEYVWQTRWQMWCAGVTRCDFVAYHPTSSGVIVPCTLAPAHAAEMAERAYLVDAMVREWVDVLQDRAKRAA